MIHFLLDTNVIIWLSNDEPRINQIKSLLFSDNTQIFISPVSWWEIAIKLRAGKLKANLDELQYFAAKHHFTELPVTSKYMKAYLELPRLTETKLPEGRFHKDPFDLMLLAQAITCPMRLITGDSVLGEYSSLVMVI